MSRSVTIFVVICAAVVTAAAVLLLHHTAQLACDQVEVTGIVKDLATKYIKFEADYLIGYLKFPNPEWKATAEDGNFQTTPTFELSAFRDRGTFGASGKSCAVSVKAHLKSPASLDFMSEYTIEPTTDGKIMVSARFSPN
jgi:hypothetical protein